MKRYFILLSLIFLIPLYGQASKLVCSRQQTGFIYETLEQRLDLIETNNWKDYLKIDRSNLRTQVRTAKIFYQCFPKNIQINFQQRPGAMYYVFPNGWTQITYNYSNHSRFKANDSATAIVLMHEYLQAMKILDNEGQVSLPFVYMSENANDNSGLLTVPNVGSPEMLPSADEGGTTTGVGGGGDLDTLLARYMLFKLYYGHLKEQLGTGKVSLAQARERLSRFLRARVVFYTSNLVDQAPAYEVIRGAGANSDFSSRSNVQRFEIGIGRNYAFQANGNGLSELYARLVVLVEKED